MTKNHLSFFPYYDYKFVIWGRYSTIIYSIYSPAVLYNEVFVTGSGGMYFIIVGSLIYKVGYLKFLLKNYFSSENVLFKGKCFNKFQIVSSYFTDTCLSGYHLTTIHYRI